MHQKSKGAQKLISNYHQLQSDQYYKRGEERGVKQ